MKPMKTPAARAMAVPGGKKAAAQPAAKAAPVKGYRDGGIVQKPHNPDNHVSRMAGYANGGMVGGKKKKC